MVLIPLLVFKKCNGCTLLQYTKNYSDVISMKYVNEKMLQKQYFTVSCNGVNITELTHKFFLCMWNVDIYRDKEEDNKKKNETIRGNIHQH